MRTRVIGMGLGLGWLLASSVGAAQATTRHVHRHTSKPAPASQPASEAQVRELMEVFGVSRMLSQMNTQMATMMQQQLTCVPASYWQGFIDDAGARELTERMVPIYQRHFTAADIQGLLKFYRTPLGKKVITEMPATMAEGMQLGQQWGRERAQTMLAQLQKEGRLDTQGRCPASPAAAPAPRLGDPAAPAPAATVH